MPVLTKINTNVIAEDAITGDMLGASAYLANTATQNISGTYSENRMYTSDAYTLSGNATINSNLVLSSTKPTGDVVLTASGAYTITGTGTLSGGSMYGRQTLTGMTGELGSTVTGGSVVTGSPNLNLSNATFPSGHVLQVVSSNFTGTFSVSGGATQNPEEWHFIGLNVRITPTSTSSLIFLIANVVHAANNNSYLTILRNGSSGLAGGASNNLAKPDSPGSRQPTFTGDGSVTNTNYQSQGNSMFFLDNPNTTSATTYNVGVSIHSSASLWINRTQSDNDAGWQPRGVSTLTAMEIEG